VILSKGQALGAPKGCGPRVPKKTASRAGLPVLERTSSSPTGEEKASEEQLKSTPRKCLAHRTRWCGTLKSTRVLSMTWDTKVKSTREKSTNGLWLFPASAIKKEGEE